MAAQQQQMANAAVANWLASDPGATDELLYGNSMWPTLLCACCYPWFILSRAAGRAGVVDEFTAIWMGLLLYGCLFVGGVMMESFGGVDDGVAVAGVLLQLIYIAGVFGGTMALRRHLRQRYNIPGTAVVDCIASIYPCSVWGLATLDRQAEVATQPPAAGAPREDGMSAHATAAAPRAAPGVWATSLFDCWPAGCPVFQCAFCAPWFIQLRLIVRFGTSSPTLWAVGLFLLYSLGTLFSVDGSDGIDIDIRLLLSILGGTCLLVHIFVTYHLRTRVRARYAIPGSDLTDVAVSVFCAPCALTQMEQQTADLVKRPALQPPGNGDEHQQTGLPPAPGAGASYTAAIVVPCEPRMMVADPSMVAIPMAHQPLTPGIPAGIQQLPPPAFAGAPVANGTSDAAEQQMPLRPAHL